MLSYALIFLPVIFRPVLWSLQQGGWTSYVEGQGPQSPRSETGNESCLALRAWAWTKPPQSLPRFKGLQMYLMFAVTPYEQGRPTLLPFDDDN